MKIIFYLFGKLLPLAILLMAMQVRAASLSVQFPDITVSPGGTAEMVVSYETDYSDLSGFQVEFILPEGITLADAKAGNSILQACPDLSFNFVSKSDEGKSSMIGNTLSAALPSGKQDFLVLTLQADANLGNQSFEVSTTMLEFSGQNLTIKPDNQTFIIVTDNPISLFCPDNNHPHMIDLGLPSGTLWACCNVDDDHTKQSPTNYGGYYAWGETETKTTYDWSDYIHCDGAEYTCHDLGSDIAGTQYDVAHVKWGGNWVMPSKEQQDELEENCTYESTIVNGVNGGKLTSKSNGSSIFLPTAGFLCDIGLVCAGSHGGYWSSTMGPYKDYAYLLSFTLSNSYERYGGFSVRPVCTSLIKASNIRGDVSGDKAISITDVAMLVSHILGENNKGFLSANADVNGDGAVSVTDVMVLVNIILTGKGVSSVELPEEAAIDASDLTIYSDGEQMDVGENGLLGACVGDMMAFNGDSLVYLSYGSQSDARTLNSLETAISLLLPVIPFAVTDMDDDSFWLLKLMIGHLEQTRELASAIDQSIIDKGYLDMDAINPQYLAAVAELQSRLGIDDSVPVSRKKRKSKTTNPFFVYGERETYGDGFTLVKEHGIWKKGEKGDCWDCEFTVFNGGLGCYTSLTKAYKTEEGAFRRLDTSFSDTFTNLIKPMNVSAFMDWGILSDFATNPKDFLKDLSDPDFGRLESALWEPLKNLGHVIKGEETEISSFDKIKKEHIKFELYPDNEHLEIVGPGIDDNLAFFNAIKIIFQPILKMIMKEYIKSDVYKKSDLIDQLVIQFVKYISEMDLDFRNRQLAILNDPDLSWWNKISTVWNNIDEKMAMFLVKDVMLGYFSEEVFDECFADVAKGYNDPTVRTLFAAYNIILKASDIIMYAFEKDYRGIAFEMDYGPSYESYHERQYENFTVGDVTFTMMKLPGGPFMMGAENDDEQADGSERPLHYINLNKFAIGETEVTQSLWQAVMGSNPSKFVNGNRPVDNVSWLDCQEFITKLNQLTGRTFRLPTEAEWEFAACGGMYKRGYPFAGGENIDDVAWYKENSDKETHAVRLKNANEFGLYDMSGNVMEWCQDFYDAHYYDNSPEDDPCNEVTATHYAHVLRGGSWHWNDKYCRVTSRTSNGQGVKAEQFGLRLAMDLTDSPQTYLTCPDDHHPHLIDLGLPSGTKWACCNVDTDHPENQSPENYGGYYAWGETEEKEHYDWSTYTHCDGSSVTCHDLGSDIAGTQYDVAHVKWGGSWVMPTKEQLDELKDNCTYEWTTVNGVKGDRFTSKINGGSIFLPAAGYRDDSGLRNAGLIGLYWSSTQRPSYADYAYYLFFYSGDMYTSGNGRFRGQSVRPVVRN